MDSSARKLKAQKDYLPEKPEAVLDFSDSLDDESEKYRTASGFSGK